MDGRALAGLLATALGAVAVPASLYVSTTERHTAAAAHVVTQQARPDDLIIVSSTLAGRQPDPAGLIRPFGDLAPVVVDPARALPDLSTFPQRRVFLVGNDLAPAAFGLDGGKTLAPDVTLVERTGTSLVHLMEKLSLSVERNGVERRCDGKHPAGGVRCGSKPWQYMAPSVVKANERAIACLWAHPIHEHMLRVDVPVTGNTRGTLWLQFTDEAMSDPPHKPIVFEAQLHGIPSSRVECRNQRPGHCELPIAVSPTSPEGSVPGAPALRLRISTEDASRQLVCLGGVLEVAP